MQMAWGARHVLGAAKHQCGWSRISWVRRTIDFSGFFPLQMTKISPTLLQWIKRKENVLVDIIFNIHGRAHFSHSWGTGEGSGSKAITSGACISLGLVSDFFSPSSGSDSQPTSSLSSAHLVLPGGSEYLPPGDWGHCLRIMWAGLAWLRSHSWVNP